MGPCLLTKAHLFQTKKYAQKQSTQPHSPQPHPQQQSGTIDNLLRTMSVPDCERALIKEHYFE